MAIYPLARQRLLPALTFALMILAATTASAKVIHSSADQAMAHRDGRDGELVGSTAVEAPDQWHRSGEAVGITFDAGYAQRTNMPRAQRHEGPVSDRTPPDVLHGWADTSSS